MEGGNGRKRSQFFLGRKDHSQIYAVTKKNSEITLVDDVSISRDE